MDWQIFAAVAVPLLGVLSTFVQADRSPGAYRRLKHSAAALEQVPADSAARRALDQLVTTQAEHLMKWEERKLSRRLNSSNLILVIILLALGGAAGYFLWAWCAAAWGTGWIWLALPLSVLVGLFLIAFIGVGFGQIYSPAKTADERAREKAVRAAARSR